MNWFERHLNWTTLGFFIGSILGFLFFRVSLSFNSIDWNYPLDLSFPSILLLALFIAIWYILTAIGYGWILFKKNRSLFFLLFFTPALFTIFNSVIYKFFFFSNINYYVVYTDALVDPIIRPPIFIFIVLFNILIFVIGSIVLISLRSRNQFNSTDYPLTNNSTNTTQNGFLNYLYSSEKRFKHILFSISGLAVIFSIISFFFTTFGYVTYNLPESLSSEFPKISFEYPAKYIEPIYHKMKIYTHYGGDEYYFNSYIDIYYFLRGYTDSNIYIGFSQLSTNQTYISYLDEYEDSLLKRYNNPQEYQQIVRSTTTVGDISARQFAVSVRREFIDEIDWNDFGSNIYVYFEHQGYIWNIRYSSWNKVATQPPPYFTHLLESFKFQDK
jgi:hypothetical protein